MALYKYCKQGKHDTEDAHADSWAATPLNYRVQLYQLVPVPKGQEEFPKQRILGCKQILNIYLNIFQVIT